MTQRTSLTLCLTFAMLSFACGTKAEDTTVNASNSSVTEAVQMLFGNGMTFWIHVVTTTVRNAAGHVLPGMTVHYECTPTGCPSALQDTVTDATGRAGYRFQYFCDETFSFSVDVVAGGVSLGTVAYSREACTATPCMSPKCP